MLTHSSHLSDRPRRVAAGELISQGMRILLVGAGARLRRLRGALHAMLQPARAETYQPMPSYRLCTSDGVLQLTEGLAKRLVELLQAKVQQERQ